MQLTEYKSETITCRPPPRAARESLDRQLGDRLQLLWLAGDQLRVASRAWVGVVRLPDETSIRIVPKLAGDELRVLQMLALTNGLPPIDIPRLSRDLSTDADGDLLDLLCALLCRTTQAVLTDGPLRDYRDEGDDLPVLRGGLDVRRQALTHHGRVDVLACRFQEFDHDVLENRILRQASNLARNAARNPVIRRRASILHDQLTMIAPGPCPAAADCRQLLQYDRRNDHYRGAHVWALAMIEDQRIARPFHDAGTSAAVFLLDMNRLFEDFLTWLVTETMTKPGLRVIAQHRDRSLLWSDGKPWGTVVPDLLICTPNARLAVDAKYKRYDLKSIAADDLYQLFFYAQAYRGFGPTPTAVMVYPSESRGTPVTISLNPAGHTAAAVHTISLGLADVVDRIAAGGLIRAETLADVGRTFERAFGLTSEVGDRIR